MNDTPMMKQYLGFKKQYPGKIVLFRMGDFFETFGDDAKTTSKVLNITLTRRDKKSNPTPLAGFPHKAIEQYLPKLVEAGYCVVIVDQLEDPKLAKGIVKRGVTRIVTPGTLDGEQADSTKDSYLAAIYVEKKIVSISLCDISTGKFLLLNTPYTENFLETIISSYEPMEVLLLEDEKNVLVRDLPVQILEKSLKNNDYAEKIVTDFYRIKSPNALDIEKESPDLISVGMILKYIEDTQMMDPKHISKPMRINIKRRMTLDRSTIRNLELVRGSYTGEVEDSLFSIIDRTSTRMGRRLLYSWVLNPLIEKNEIDSRLDFVEMMFNDDGKLYEIRKELENISDIDRILGKIGLNRVSARDLKALEISLTSSLLILEKLGGNFKKDLDTKPITEVVSTIQKTINDDPPLSVTEGGIIKAGLNSEIDKLRDISGTGKSWIKEFEESEKKKTGIQNLKVRFNKVFGYYIEITKSNQDKVPERYIRKQTLVNCERYITEELKEKEDLILNSQDRLYSLEYHLFDEFRQSLTRYISDMSILSNTISNIDVLCGFAYLAIENKYTRPKLYDMGEKDGLIEIKGGRHPIVESLVEEDFISNDTLMNMKDSNISILTGPNMSGKSTYIRQVATIVLLAQIGSFVPAKEAVISITDRIFTRVGASDDLSRGRSTFMVEMDETANIVNNATKFSLVILDEIGRGTSTYDGVSIAWALSEYLIKDIKARTLFATHYHELLKLAEKYPEKVKNLNVLVEEDLEKGTVTFLRKIISGGTDRSYGIYVAKMAGLPEKVITRANEILEGFEQRYMFNNEENVIPDLGSRLKDQKVEKTNNGFQYPLFSAKESEIEREIQNLDIDNLTPIEALNKISAWKKRI